MNAVKRIYLDLDGVIFPLDPLDESEVTEHEVEALHEREWWRRDVVRRLGELGVEIVLASSWGEQFLAGRIEPSPKRELHAVRALPVSLEYSKAEAVAHDLLISPAQFAWIEDDLTRSMIERVREATHETSRGAYIRTYGKHGLQLAELDAIESYFTE